MSHRAPTVLLLLSLVLASTGCSQQRLNEDKSRAVDPGETWQAFIVDAPKAQQKIRIEITASEPVDIDVATGGNQATVQSSLEKGKRPEASAVVASKQQVKSDSLEATIPAGQAFTVFVSGGKKRSDVKAKLRTP